MRRRTKLLVSVMMGAVLLATVAGVVWAKTVQCKPNRKCEGTRNADLLVGTPKPDRIFGLGGGDDLLGLGDADKLVGSKGDDNLEGGDNDQANDTLNGGEDEDLYRFVDNWGDEVIIDTVISDPAPFSANDVLILRTGVAGNPVIVDLNSDSGPLPEVSDGANNINWDGNVIDSVRVRTDSNDFITGNRVANYIENNDTTGSDEVSGGEGHDTIENGDHTGNDQLSSGRGNDLIFNSDQSGVDTVSGGEGNDEINSEGYEDNGTTYSGGNDIVNAGAGDDIVDVQDQFPGDVVNCGDGTDNVFADTGDVLTDCEG